MSTATAYFDWNASAPLRAEAKAAMLAALECAGNPSSVHRSGRAARAVLEEVRATVLRLAGAQTGLAIFTSGASEANNLALEGLMASAANNGKPIAHLVVSAIEHESVLAVAAALERKAPGLKVTQLAPDAQGIVTPSALEDALKAGPYPALVAIMAANNETGAVQPISALAETAKAHGAHFHCDAAQAPGRIALAFDTWHADTLALSGHKLGGPQGCGALILRQGMGLVPQIRGGGQEFGMRAGTQNVAAAAGMGAAARAALEELAHAPALEARRNRLEEELLTAAPHATIHSRGAHRLPQTLCIGLPGIAAETQVMALDLDGIAVSAGSACSSGKVKPSHVLAAMGLDKTAAAEAIRISFGYATPEAAFGQLVAAYARLAERARARSAA